MEQRSVSWKTVILWGLLLVAVLMIGAVVDWTGASGSCMFILAAYFAALVATYPVLRANRFGTGLLVFAPYALIGFAPLYFFDWLDTHALRGLWAVFVWTASGPLIGLTVDIVNHLLQGRSEKVRAISIGAAMQAMTFITTLLGLGYLYVPTSAMAGHLHFYTREWYFSLPWMLLNGGFGGYTAYALSKRV